MRSLIVAPPDEKRLAEALESGADALVVDLAPAAPEGRDATRRAAALFLGQARAQRVRPRLIIKVHPLDSGETDRDLDAVMGAPPDAILLPGSFGAASVQQLSAKLALREAELAFADGVTRIIAIADTARGLLAMASYRGASARLIGLAWDARALRADLGAETERDESGGYAGPCRLARELTLFAAAAAGVAAIDAPFADASDPDGLRAEVTAARRDGFRGKMATDAAQVRVINGVFAVPPARRLGSEAFRPVDHTNP